MAPKHIAGAAGQAAALPAHHAHLWRPGVHILTLTRSQPRTRLHPGVEAVTLEDCLSHQRFRAVGDGTMDLNGRVFGQWLLSAYPGELAALGHQTGGVCLDGAQGLAHLEQVATRIGLALERRVTPNGELICLTVRRSHGQLAHEGRLS
jgi:hypothetical protein